jgi:hypothetical protein
MTNFFSKVYCMVDNIQLSQGKPGDETWPSLKESWENKLGPLLQKARRINLALS